MGRPGHPRARHRLQLIRTLAAANIMLEPLPGPSLRRSVSRPPDTGGAGPREVDARYLRGTWQVDQGHRLGRQVAVVLAWPVTPVRHLLAVCGYRVSADSAGAVSVWVIAAGGWFVRLASAHVRPCRFSWGTEFCLLVCAGQAVLRTVSVAVRAMGRLDCGCRKSHPRHATRRYSLIVPPARVCLRTRYCPRMTGCGSGFSGAAERCGRC